MAQSHARPESAAVQTIELAGLLRRAETLRRGNKLGEAAAIGQRILKRDPHHSGALHLMGVLALETGAGEIAAGMMTRALAQQPKSPTILVDYARAMHMHGRNAEAVTAFRKALALRPRDIGALCGLGEALVDLGKKAEALKCYRQVLALSPDHRLAAHMVEALDSRRNAATNSYVADLFDGYADKFDKHLVETLEYRAPDLIADGLARHLPQGAANALDIGCGTGLVAAALAAKVEAIDGIDLSPAMIEAARAKGLYRHLAAGDSAAVLAENPQFAGPYQLVLAGDVFVYVGDLEATFAAVRQALAPQGHFLFTVEHAETGDYTVRSSARFAHSEAYIADLSAKNGLRMLEVSRVTLRKERYQPIVGRLTVLQRSED